MAKSFVIIAREVARSWSSNLRPGSIHSWADLRSKLKTNFKGVGTNTVNSTEILNCHQGQNVPLRDWWRRFIQIKAKTPGISDESVILIAIAGIHPGPCHSKLSRRNPKTLFDLHDIMEKQTRADTDHRAKTEAFRPQTPLTHPRQQRNEQHRQVEPVLVRAIDTIPPQQNNVKPPQPQREQQNPSDNRTTLNNKRQREPSKPYCHYCGPEKGHTTK